MKQLVVGGATDIERAYYIFSPKRYNIVIYSGLAITFSLAGLFWLISPESSMFSLIVMLPAWLLAYRLSTAEARVHFTSEGLRFHWIKNFRFMPDRDFMLEFSNMQNFTHDIWGAYHYHRFTMHDGSVKKIVLDRKNSNNYEFNFILDVKIQAYNNKHPLAEISKGNSFFQRPLAKLLSVIFAIVLSVCWIYFYPKGMHGGKLTIWTFVLGVFILITLVANLKKRS